MGLCGRRRHPSEKWAMEPSPHLHRPHPATLWLRLDEEGIAYWEPPPTSAVCPLTTGSYPDDGEAGRRSPPRAPPILQGLPLPHSPDITLRPQWHALWTRVSVALRLQSALWAWRSPSACRAAAPAPSVPLDPGHLAREAQRGLPGARGHPDPGGNLPGWDQL